jgi:hypothetical protein
VSANRNFQHTPGVVIEVSGVSLSNSPYTVCVDGPMSDAWAEVLKRDKYRRWSVGPDPESSARWRQWMAKRSKPT